ncbi:hypothetical protein [Corynebacterium cystitidis]|uniref:hypothetical protein n=1 Tax=Corynebacterium cystitidis TaxID=35757 RepID=UPI00211E5B17|nr:hypothetical protein [Corynebacterium cystitidis]
MKNLETALSDTPTERATFAFTSSDWPHEANNLNKVWTCEANSLRVTNSATSWVAILSTYDKNQRSIERCESRFSGSG